MRSATSSAVSERDARDAGIVHLLEADPRPSFVVATAAEPPRILYANPALTSRSHLSQLVSSSSSSSDRSSPSKFWEWITGRPSSPPRASPTMATKAAPLPTDPTAPTPPSTPPHLPYADHLWTRTVVQQGMVVVGANKLSPSEEPLPPRTEPPSRVFSVAAEPTVPSLKRPTSGMQKRSLTVGFLNASPDTNATTSAAAGHSSRAAQNSATDMIDNNQTGAPASSSRETDPHEHAPDPAPAVERSRSVRRSVTDPGWILPNIVLEQQSFLEVMHGADWESSPLGPMAEWPEKLQQTFNQILGDIRPIAIYWGPACSTVYNEAFSRVVGARHPALLGKSVEEAWPEAGLRLKETMQNTSAKNGGNHIEDEWSFFIERPSEVEGRPNWLEETYVKWSLSPISQDNECLGFAHSVIDTTSARLWERRISMLLDLGETLGTARDVRSYWERTIKELTAIKPHYDIPLAVLYSVEDDTQKASGIAGTSLPTPPIEASKIFRLEGSLGIPNDHASIPKRLRLGPAGSREEEKGAKEDMAFRVLFREVLSCQSGPLLLRTEDGTLPATFFNPDFQSRGFGDPIRAAVCLPIRPTRTESVMGVLFLGLNPRRPYDNDYRQYVALLSQKLTTSLASIVLLEEETRRGRNAAEQAEYDQAMLEEKLAMRTREATESTRNFETVAEFVPVGMCFGDLEGNITFANDAWYRLTGYPAGSVPMRSSGFLDCAKEEDRDLIRSEYKKLAKTQNATFEFRIKKPTDGFDEEPRPSTTASSLPRNTPNFDTMGMDLASTVDELTERHILATAKADPIGEGGDAIRVLTCLTDVTAHKRATEEAVRRAQQSSNLSKLAELATVGMYDMGLDGRLLGANKVFFEMCGLPQGIDLTKADQLKPWETCVWAEDRKLLDDALEQMVLQDRMQTVEVRLKSPWHAEDGSGQKVVAPRWAQATLLPVRASNGVVDSFTGCMSDVSLQKWQLAREKRRKEEAIESKRQQENFIDMTSHEMRNPLSAILQCTDEISGALSQLREEIQHDPAGSAQLAMIDTCLEAADTIQLCAAHQKRIVDDILTLSKLDANLLAVTPVTVDPILVVQEILRMHDLEAQRVDITLKYEVSQSYLDLNIKYLDFDPSRLKQILINLLGNALKFTKSGPQRNVTVVIGASRTRPDDVAGSVHFIPRQTLPDPPLSTSSVSAADSAASPIDAQSPSGDHGPHGRPYDHQSASDAMMMHTHPGESMFLVFKVKDTGKGLAEHEAKNLFNRFVQASSRTHVKYGGSGLGLFISRQLTELQNGAIGVASQPGVGSTFAFYIEAYLPSEEALLKARAAAEAAAQAATVARGSPLPSPPTGLLRGGRLSVTERRGTTGQTGTLANGTGVEEKQRKGPGVVDKQARDGKRAGTTKGPLIPEIEGVLVVEDNVINQQITQRGLVGLGFTVDVANHGVECLEKLKQTDRYAGKEDDPLGSSDNQHVPSNNDGNNSGNASTPPQTGSGHKPFKLSMILMDMEMPVQDGLTCTRRIRELEAAGHIRGGRIPIIAVSANARTEQMLEARAAGCDGLLAKPFRLPELLEQMRITMNLMKGDKKQEGGAKRGGEGSTDMNGTVEESYGGKEERKRLGELDGIPTRKEDKTEEGEVIRSGSAQPKPVVAGALDGEQQSKARLTRPRLDIPAGRDRTPTDIGDGKKEGGKHV